MSFLTLLYLFSSCWHASSQTASLPFTESFSSNALAGFWTVSGTGSYHVSVSTNGPRSYPFNAILDSAVPNSYARSELTLRTDLYWWTNVTLSFYAKGFHDEPHGPPPNPFVGGADFDGVAISPNGVEWYEVQSLRALTTNYTRFSVPLDAFLRSNNLSYTSNFYIRFNQYDDFPAPSDGIAIDDVSVNGLLKLPLPYAPAMVVSPLSDITFTGAIDGPFFPATQSYVVTNTSLSNLSFYVTSNVNWLSITSPLPKYSFAYELPPSQAATVTVSIANYPVGLLPVGSYTGAVQFINYAGGFGSATQLVSLIIVTNSPPTAFPQTNTLAEDSSLPIQLGGSDPDGQFLTAIISRLPDRGTLYQTSDGINLGPAITNPSTVVSNTSRIVIYVPYKNENGSNYANFGFRTRDNRTTSPEASVLLHVTPVPDLPLAVDDRVSTLPGESSLPFDPLENDEHPDGEQLTLVSFTQPAHGAVTQTSTGLLIYTPASSFLRGQDMFTYTVQDRFGQTSSAKVNAYVGVLMGGDWPMRGAGPSHTCYYPGKLGTATLQQRWLKHFTTGMGNLVIGQGKVFMCQQPSIGLHQNRRIVIALNATNGLQEWQGPQIFGFGSPPVYSGNRVYALGDDRELYSLDAGSGQYLWLQLIPNAIPDISPLVFRDGVILRTDNSFLNGVSTNGSLRFSKQPETPYSSLSWAPSYYKDTIYCWQGTWFSALNPAEGGTKWKIELSNPRPSLQDIAAALDHNRAFVLTPLTLYAIDVENRTVVWSRSESNSSGAAFRGTPLVAHGVVYCLGTNGIRSFRASDGTSLGEFGVDDWPQYANPSAIVTDDSLFVSTETNTYIFKLTGELQQKIPYGGEVSVSDGCLFISSRDGQVTAWSAPAPNDLMVTASPFESTNVVGEAFIQGFAVTNSGPSNFINVGFVVQFLGPFKLNWVKTTRGAFSTDEGAVSFSFGEVAPGTSVAVDLSLTATNVGFFDGPYALRGEVFAPPATPLPGGEIAFTSKTIKPVTINSQNLSILEGDAGISQAVFPIWLSASNQLPIRVQYRTIPMSAVPTNDYIPIEGTLVFQPGVLTQALNIPIVGNRHFEANKNFYFQFDIGTNSAFAPGSGSTITIVNDDPPPVWSISDTVVTEGNQGTKNVQFQVSVSPPGIHDYYQAYYTVNGTALADEDYFATEGTLFFPAGVTNQVISVTVRGDTIPENDEAFYVELAGRTNATFAKRTAVCTILNDDGLTNAVDHFEWGVVPNSHPANSPFPVEIQTKDAVGNLVAGFQGPVRITWASLQPEVVVGAGSYVSSDALNFAASYRYSGIYASEQLCGPRRIKAIALEPTSTTSYLLQGFTVRLKHASIRAFSGGTGNWDTNGWTIVYKADQKFTTNGWIVFWFDTPFDYNGLDNLMLDISFYDRAAVRSFPSFRGTFTPEIKAIRSFSLTWSDPTTWGGLASAANDLFNVRFIGDEMPIPPQIVMFTNGVWTGSLVVPFSGTNVYLRAQDDKQHQGLSTPISSFLTNDLLLTLLRTPSDPIVNSPYSFSLVVSNGPASVSTGVTLTNLLPSSWSVISVSSSNGACTPSNGSIVCALGDLPPESWTEVNILALPGTRSWGTNYASIHRNEPEPYLGNNSTITKFDTRSPVYVSISNAFGYEPTSSHWQPIYFTVNLNAPPSFSEPVTVFYSSEDGTASSGSTNRDYVGRSGYLTFNPGNKSQVISFDVELDSLIEDDETFAVRISGATNAVITNAVATGTIIDRTPVNLSLSTDVGVLEGPSGITNFLVFTASLDRPSPRSVSVQYDTYDITALAGSDYVSTAGYLIFPPGTMNQNILVPIIGDDMGETNETFALRLSGVTNATLLNSLAIGTITNDDLPTIMVDDVNLQEFTFAGVSGSFRLTLLPPATNPVQVSYSTLSGSALVGKDFVGTNGTLTFAPGQVVTNIPITILPDRIAEETKSFFLVLTNPVGAVLARNAAQGFIHDADGPGRLYAEYLIPDDSLGDQDGVVNAGETIRVWIRLRNTMSTAFDGARGTLFVGPATNPPVTLLRSNSLFPLIASGQVVTNSLPYVLRLGRNQGCSGAFYLSHVVEFGNSKVTNRFGFSFGVPVSSWKITTPDSAPQVGAGCSIEIDRLGQKHLSYHDGVSHSVKHALHDGYGWRTDVVGPAATSATETALGIASNGLVRIVYSGPDAALMLASSTGSNWTYEIVPDSLNGSRPSLAVTGPIAHVSFYSPGSQCLRHAMFDGTNWLSEAVDCGTGGRGHFSSLALFKSMPRITYTDGWTNGLKLASWTGASWALTNLDTAEAHGAFPSMQINASGEPAIAYADQEQARVLLVEKRGNLWTNSVVPAQSLSPLASISMRLDPQGNPYVAVLSSTPDYVAYFYRTGGVWNGDAGFNARFPLERLSLALNSNSIAEIAFNGPSTNGLRTASKLGCSAYNTIPVAFPQLYFGSIDANIPVQLMGNDFDGDALQWKLASSPLHGSITNFNASKGTLNYLANPTFEGADSFTYQVGDGLSLSQPALVTLELFADTDGDGMSDSWEIAHSLNPFDPGDAMQDNDGDGIPNVIEFRAHTDPNNPNSLFKIQSTIESKGYPYTSIQVQFTTEAGKKYRLLRVGGLGDSGWTPAGATVSGTGGTQLLSDQVETGTGPWFYRVEAFQ